MLSSSPPDSTYLEAARTRTLLETTSVTGVSTSESVDNEENRRINIFNIPHDTVRSMSLEIEHDCPECGGSREFYRAASTTVHLGEKTKWRCTECDYGFVLIDDVVDSSA